MMTELESQFYLHALEIVLKSGPMVIGCITLCFITYFAWRSYQLARSSSVLVQHHTDNSDKITKTAEDISEQLKDVLSVVTNNTRRLDLHDEILKAHDILLDAHAERISEHTAQIVEFKKRNMKT